MKQLFFVLLFIPFSQHLAAQLSITDFGTPTTVTFTGFTGSGFLPAPGAGQLNSNDWVITGFSDGNLVYGGSKTTGDYARGTTSGGVTVGGIYAYQYDGDNTALWIQPASADFNPGTITLRSINSTGGIINSLAISYTAFVLNDAPRGSTWNFSYSLNDTIFTNVSSVNIVSDSTANDSLYTFLMSTIISGLNVSSGQFIYLRWNSQDVSGLGTRDELGLDDISITVAQQAACDKPTNVTISNITSSSATVSWDAVINATKYKVWYRPVGAPAWTKKSSYSNSKNFSGLLAATQYQCKVKAICGDLKSKFSSLKTFTTLPLKIPQTLQSKRSSIYPNPGNGLFLITIPETDQTVTISVFDQLGRQVKRMQKGDEKNLISIDLTGFSDGMYIVIVDSDNQQEILKVVKE